MDHPRTLRQTAKRDGSSRLAEGEAGDPRLLNAHSGDFEALLQVGFLRCQQGRYADALNAADREAEIAAEFELTFVTPYAQFNRARALTALRDFGGDQLNVRTPWHDDGAAHHNRVV